MSTISVCSLKVTVNAAVKMPKKPESLLPEQPCEEVSIDPEGGTLTYFYIKIYYNYN